MSKARSREEWTGLTEAWKRSGESAEAFAESHGVRPRTLAWWAWRLGSEKGSSKPKTKAKLRMVPVTVRPSPWSEPGMIEVSVGATVVRFPAETAAKTIGDVVFEIRALEC